MQLKYYNHWTTGDNEPKFNMAIDLLEDAPLTHIATVTGVPKSVIVKGAKEMGLGHLLKNQTRFDMIVADLEEEVTPTPGINETREERFNRLHNSLANYQGKCAHPMMHCRCSKCLKILGSELHFKNQEQIEAILKWTLDDLWDPNDEVQNLTLEKFYRSFRNKLHETILSKAKE